jgi:hypothetical protein
MSEQAFWYDGGPRDPDFLDVAGSDLGLEGNKDEDDEDDEDDLEDLLR